MKPSARQSLPRIPRRRRLARLAGLLWLAGCSALPRDAPMAQAVRADATTTTGSEDARVPYALVKLSASNLAAINRARGGESSNLAALAGKAAGARNVLLGVGDILNVSIFESAPGGLFVPAEAGTRTGNFVQAPNEQIDASGMINVPYAGNVRIAGLTPRAAGEEISRRLARRAIEPQTVVSLVDRRSSEVSVLGDLNTPNRFALDPGGMSLVDAIARAGGNRDPDYETLVTIQRGGRDYRGMLSAIVAHPAENVGLAPGDVVFLAHRPRFFTLFGATGEPAGPASRRVTFESESMTLAEGLAKGGGLSDERADPSSVFVFRVEPKRVLREFGVDVGPFATDTVATVYALDLSSSDGVFLMSRLLLAGGDVVVVANAASVELMKFLNIVTQSSFAAYNYGGARYDLRN
jgi:polysaccharide export outer membrane protein